MLNRRGQRKKRPAIPEVICVKLRLEESCVLCAHTRFLKLNIAVERSSEAGVRAEEQPSECVCGCNAGSRNQTSDKNIFNQILTVFRGHHLLQFKK
jgi:hypothetical protein